MTHNHQDHIKTATLHRLMKDTTRILAPANCDKLIDLSFERVQPGDEREIGPFKIRATYAYNKPEGSSTRKPHKRGQCVGYIVEVGGKRIYHAGETDVISEMGELGPLDVAFLPVGGTFTINLPEAIACAGSLLPRLFIPMHFLHVTREQAEAALTGKNITYKLPAIG